MAQNLKAARKLVLDQPGHDLGIDLLQVAAAPAMDVIDSQEVLPLLAVIAPFHFHSCLTLVQAGWFHAG
jgi:hypothetical protein